MTKVATSENVKKSLEKRMEDQIRKLDSQKVRGRIKLGEYQYARMGESPGELYLT